MTDTPYRPLCAIFARGKSYVEGLRGKGYDDRQIEIHTRREYLELNGIGRE